ncbi:hypothetical protein V6N11_053258 [Hibiscus sabdariffa]|uniref:Uncharacterized protein n=1 Tax=Hibiscus sabdariffa TaxID=183260 RepID=A0ABR2UCK2_9ROSI
MIKFSRIVVWWDCSVCVVVVGGLFDSCGQLEDKGSHSEHLLAIKFALGKLLYHLNLTPKWLESSVDAGVFVGSCFRDDLSVVLVFCYGLLL